MFTPILKTYNSTYLYMVAITIALIVAFWLIFRKKSDFAKRFFIIAFCAVNIIIFFVYKYYLSIDTQYLEASGTGFNWFNELPLQLCNINMFLIPIGVLTNKRGIMGFSFFMAPFGAMMALLFPEPAFNGYSIFMPRMLGFYITHVFVFIGGITLSTLGFFRPHFRDLPKVGLTLGILGITITGVNFLFRALGLCDFTNYFFTMGPNGVSILEFFYGLVKIPFIYLIPATPILLVYFSVICLLFLFFEKKFFKNEITDEKTGEKETVTTK